MMTELVLEKLPSNQRRHISSFWKIASSALGQAQLSHDRL
jgi:hypothetical protein